MSIWTHVNGSVRIDYLRFEQGEGLEIIKAAFGRTVEYDDPEEKWDSCTVPCGSEGSLQYEIYENPHINHMSSYRVQIWGDLRDYDDIEEIKKWFQNAIKNLMTRSAILEIDVESQDKAIILINDDSIIYEYKVYEEQL